MRRTHAAAGVVALVLLLAGCNAEQPADQQPQAASEPPGSASDGVTLEGDPPAGALPFEIAEQRRVHELTLAPASLGETVDVTKDAPARTEEFDVTVETADGKTQEKVDNVQPLRIPYTDGPFTVTYAPAEGQPDNGTLTVEFADGKPVSDKPSNEGAPQLDSHRVAHEVTIAWDEAEPGYAVVLRGPGTGTGNNKPGSASHFTDDTEFRLAVGAGERMAVAVYPGFTEPSSVQTAPVIDPAGDVSTIVAPRE